MQQIQLNIIPITPVSNTLTFSFFGEKFPKSASIKWDKLFDEFPEGRAADKQSYYSPPNRSKLIVNQIHSASIVAALCELAMLVP